MNNSLSTHGVISEPSRQEGKGREGKGIGTTDRRSASIVEVVSASPRPATIGTTAPLAAPTMDGRSAARIGLLRFAAVFSGQLDGTIENIRWHSERDGLYSIADLAAAMRARDLWALKQASV